MQLRRLWRRLLLSIALVGTGVTLATADAREPRMGVFTKPGARVDLSLEFTDSGGSRGRLSSMIVEGKPFILVPIFYRCPRLCGLTVSGVVDLLNALPLELGRDYSVVAYSFNPADTARDAADKRSKTLARLNRGSATEKGLHFLTADPATITRINEQLGFRIRYADKEIEHSSAIFIISPDGSVRRYFAGVEFSPVAVEKALR